MPAGAGFCPCAMGSGSIGVCLMMTPTPNPQKCGPFGLPLRNGLKTVSSKTPMFAKQQNAFLPPPTPVVSAEIISKHILAEGWLKQGNPVGPMLTQTHFHLSREEHVATHKYECHWSPLETAGQIRAGWI